MSRLAAKIRCNYYPLPDREADLIRSCMVFPDQEHAALDPCAQSHGQELGRVGDDPMFRDAAESVIIAGLSSGSHHT